MKNVVIHIGYHKSGSTYLQNYLFTQLPVNYLFLAGYRRRILNMVLSMEKFNQEEILAWINEKIVTQYGSFKYGTTLLSHEELSGHPHGYQTEDMNPFVTAKNLNSLFPDGKFLAVVRNQFDYLLSLYAFRVAIKGEETRSLRRFLYEEGKRGLLEKLEYDRVILYYKKLVGAKNLLVLPVELLKNQPDCFHRRIASFLNISLYPISKTRVVNESTKLKLPIQLFRPINMVFSLLITFLQQRGYGNTEEYPFLRLRYSFYKKKQLITKFLNMRFPGTARIELPSDDYWRGELFERFALSNQRLEDAFQMKLERYGYPMTS